MCLELKAITIVHLEIHYVHTELQIVAITLPHDYVFRAKGNYNCAFRNTHKYDFGPELSVWGSP